MKRFLLISLLFVFAVSCSSVDSDYVEIGVILPLTGPSAELGTPIYEAMKLAEIQVNDTIKGKKLKLLFEDGKSTANGSIFAFNKLQASKPECYVIFGDVPCSSLAESIAKYDVPVITLAAAAGNILSLNEHYFRSWTTSSVSGRELAKYAKSTLNKTKGAMFCMDNNYGKEFSKIISENFIDKGGEVVITETFDSNTSSISNTCHKIISQSPDVVFIIGFGSGYISAVKQLRVLGYKGPILTDDTITISEYSSSLSGYLDSVYFSSIQFSPYDKSSTVYDEFVVPFYDKMGALPNVHSVFGYVTVEILADAITRCNITDENLENSLKSMSNMESIIGEIGYMANREMELPIVIRNINVDGTY